MLMLTVVMLTVIQADCRNSILLQVFVMLIFVLLSDAMRIVIIQSVFMLYGVAQRLMNKTGFSWG
jgi:hypothetical protein